MFEDFTEIAVKATCIFCNAEKAVGVEEYCDEEDGIVVDTVKTKARDTFNAAGWSIIRVKSANGVPDVMGMACPDCVGKGVVVG